MGKTILVIDDVIGNLTVINGILSENYEVRCAKSWEDALFTIKIEKPDLILLDIMMPKVDGFSACRKLKADSEYKDIPVIFTTANLDMKTKYEGFKSGAVDCIAKPIDEQALCRAVKTYIGE
jgi:CheY-like chemotaxis protein